MRSDPVRARGYQERWAAGHSAGEKARAQWGDAVPLDHAHLARYTLGDKDLEIEILDLFLGEAPRTLGQLKELAARVPTDVKGWVAGCHTLKGSARAVGAVAVAAAAERAEKEGALSPPGLEAHVDAMSGALDEVTVYISRWRSQL